MERRAPLPHTVASKRTRMRDASGPLKGLRTAADATHVYSEEARIRLESQRTTGEREEVTDRMKKRLIRIFYSAAFLTALALIIEAGHKGGHGALPI